MQSCSLTAIWQMWDERASVKSCSSTVIWPTRDERASAMSCSLTAIWLTWDKGASAKSCSSMAIWQMRDERTPERGCPAPMILLKEADKVLAGSRHPVGAAFLKTAEMTAAGSCCCTEEFRHCHG